MSQPQSLGVHKQKQFFFPCFFFQLNLMRNKSKSFLYENGSVLKRERLNLSFWGSYISSIHITTKVIQILLAFYSYNQHLWNNDNSHRTGLVLWRYKNEWHVVFPSPERGHSSVGRQGKFTNNCNKRLNLSSASPTKKEKKKIKRGRQKTHL